MRKPTEIESLYIDFDAFFANVEKQLCPNIRDVPVGITALDSEHSAFITRCYMAKAAGLKRGMRVKDARKLCPNVAIRVARPDIYVRVHNHILDIIDRFVPVQKVWSIDEMECRLIGRERTGALDLAKRIRAAIEAEIGPYVTPSIGLAPNQFLAKVGAEMNKPRGLTIIRPEDLPGPLLNLCLTDLPGISAGMELRLNRAGIHSIKDFWNIDGKHARKIWGNVEGERMWAQLRGYEIHRPETTERMFGQSRVLTKGWNSPDKAIECLNLLTVKAAYRLRRAGYLCQRLSIALRVKEPPRQNTYYRDEGRPLADKKRHSCARAKSRGVRWSAEVSFAACDDDPSLLAAMHGLFVRGVAQLGKDIQLKSVYVMLSDINKSSDISGDLFTASEAGIRQIKWAKAVQAMDSLNEKHGKALVHFGSRANLPGGFAGGKIAFGRVPDAKDFY